MVMEEGMGVGDEQTKDKLYKTFYSLNSPKI